MTIQIAFFGELCVQRTLRFIFGAIMVCAFVTIIDPRIPIILHGLSGAVSVLLLTFMLIQSRTGIPTIIHGPTSLTIYSPLNVFVRQLQKHHEILRYSKQKQTYGFYLYPDITTITWMPPVCSLPKTVLQYKPSFNLKIKMILSFQTQVKRCQAPPTNFLLHT